MSTIVQINKTERKTLFGGTIRTIEVVTNDGKIGKASSAYSADFTSEAELTQWAIKKIK